MSSSPRRLDWRTLVGGTGKVLIAVGVLMFAFVAYQLWGTGIQTAQAQDRLADEFEEMLAGTSTTTAPTTTAQVPLDTAPATTARPTTTAAPTTAPVVTAPSEGDAVARLDIPAIGMDGTMVVEGVRPSDLSKGPGHFPETPLPGQWGNAALAGHRTTYGQPFYRIDELSPGDEIVVTTLAGRYTYLVTGTVIVGPDDYQLVIPTVDDTRATLTLTSCHPRYSTRQRIVVTAELDTGRSDPLTRAAPAGSGAGALPDEPAPTTATTTPRPTTTLPAAAGAGTTLPAATTTTAPAPADPPDVDTEQREAGVDVFASGWFSDPDAYPHVALWGLVLTLVALAAWRLSRWVGRDWVGALAGVVPFAVVLYFFFENVNRLLPPGL